MDTKNDLTKNSIIKTVITFSIPFLLANLIQALYGAADLMVIGWYCSAESVAAVSTGTQVTQIITSIVSGLTLGGTVLTGKYVGMKRNDDVKETISTNLTVFFIVGRYTFFFALHICFTDFKIASNPARLFSSCN